MKYLTGIWFAGLFTAAALYYVSHISLLQQPVEHCSKPPTGNLAGWPITTQKSIDPGTEAEPLYAFKYSSDSISLCFRQVAEATLKHKALWDKDIYGPIMFVDPVTREIYTNRPDEGRSLLPHGSIYRGILPKDVILSNTDVEWGGMHWAMIMLPLPENRFDRIDLITHELFHVAQPALGFRTRREENIHLDQKDGRLYLRLELAALEAALKSGRINRALEHLRNALIFRKFRHTLYRGSGTSENNLELLEGLATYTGQMMSGRDKWQWRQYLINRLSAFKKTPTFVRSFAYETVSVYGFFLYRKDNNWNRQVDMETNLTELFIDAFGMDMRILLQSYVKQVAEDYKVEVIADEEMKREISNSALLDTYRRKFFDQPHLEIRLEKMNMSFNPQNLIPLDEDEGTIYPTVQISDNWGILTVERGGALLRTDWRWVIVPEPLEITEDSIKGDGWVIELNRNYHIEEEPGGVYLLTKKRQ